TVCPQKFSILCAAALPRCAPAWNTIATSGKKGKHSSAASGPSTTSGKLFRTRRFAGASWIQPAKKSAQADGKPPWPKTPFKNLAQSNGKPSPGATSFAPRCETHQTSKFQKTYLNSKSPSEAASEIMPSL